METKALILPQWDDMVFEHRNKAYGAYAIRQAYLKRLMLGLGLTVMLMIILLFLPKLLPDTIKDKGQPFPPGTEAKPTHPPTIIRNEQKPKGPKEKTSVKTNTIPIITTLPVDPPAKDEPANPTIIDDGTHVGGGGIDDDAILIEVPPIVEPPAPTIRDFAEVMPEYEGGQQAMMKWLAKNLRYPAAPRRTGAQGTVLVRFIVNGDGSVSDVHVLRGIHPDCDKEAIRVISMLPGWKGGRQGGMPVGVRMVLPITFRLN